MLNDSWFDGTTGARKSWIARAGCAAKWRVHFQKALAAHVKVLQPSAAELALADAAERHQPLTIAQLHYVHGLRMFGRASALRLVQGMTPTSVMKITQLVVPTSLKMGFDDS